MGAIVGGALVSGERGKPLSSSKRTPNATLGSCATGIDANSVRHERGLREA